MPRYASLVATGSYLPEREISNDLLRQRFPEPPDFVDKMEASTGILRRCAVRLQLLGLELLQYGWG